MQDAAPLRDLDTAILKVTPSESAAGAIYLHPELELGDYPAALIERLDYWAGLAPGRTFLAERDSRREWRLISYAEFQDKARRVATALLDWGLTPERPVAILSRNSIEHALVAMGACYAGIPYAPISPAYSLASSDFGRLRHVFDLLTPGLVFVSDGLQYQRALEAVARGLRLLVGKNPPGVRQAALFADFAEGPALAVPVQINRDGVAKILFTSGSTGVPKGVITTHRMLCSNQEMLRTVFPFLGEEPPVICDWLPWHHTFGGSHNLGLVLYNGGSMYIDGGRPISGEFDESLRNLGEIAATIYLNVPKGFSLLVEYMADAPAFRKHFFSRLRMAFYAGAALPQHVWDAFDRLAVQTLGARIPLLTGLGSTETAPFALCAGKTNRWANAMGLPVPGVDVKLAPLNGKLEVRVRGPNVTPGFWRQDDLTREAFDEEGYYRMGDAVRFVDPADANKGLLFDGRLAEDFKLSTGTWVSVGPLRAKLILSLAPWVRDVVIAGHGRDEVTALIFPETAAGTANRSALESMLRGFARESTGSSNRIERAIILAEEPSFDAGELTDKGSINQSAVLDRRADLVERLYAKPYDDEVIVI